MNTVNYQDLSSETLNELLNFSGYFHRIGLTADFKLMLDIYGTLFPDLKDVTRLGSNTVGKTSVEIERDWGNEAHALWKKLLKLELYAEEAEKVADYFRVLELFVSPFQYLRATLSQKLNKYHDAERKRVHGTAKKFSRIQTDPNVVIERCADCPGSGQQQQTKLKGPRTFKARKDAKIKTREEMIQEERARLLNSEDS